MAGEQDPRLPIIKTAVNFHRKRAGIDDSKLSLTSVAEGSCFGQGEDQNVFLALARTRYPYGDWIQVLGDDAVMELAFGFAQYYLKRFVPSSE